ncbi:ABC transporter substrate-binding protein [Streptomyces sp. 4N509B]|uniref:ABC transporter substrate-binding protein n=1 Tax=Streptomyces sp. 4N509B TaxID=3457413 RepID=UPI003FD35BE5
MKGFLRRLWASVWPPPGGPLQWTVVGALLAGLLAYGVVVVIDRSRPDTSCGPGVERHGPHEECVGVTDGSYVFAPYLAEISARIARENDDVVRQSERANDPVPYVTVAFILPLTSDDPIEQGHMRREVQGAHLAQLHANEQEERPAIRLVLANAGRASEQWRPAAERLAEMARSPEERLRVVTGFDVSTGNTEAAIRYLTNQANLPMVVGPLTADDLANGPDTPDAYPGLVKVVPDNSDQAEALASLYEDIAPERTLLVEDLRQNDNYIRSLSEVFREHTSGSPHIPQPFRSPDDINDEANLANDFRQMINTVCDMDGVDTIYFAGRNVQLRMFVNALGQRGCDEKDYTVVTISGASTLITDEQLDWSALEGGITVRYTTVTHPDAWTTGSPPATGGSAADFHELTEVIEEAGMEREVRLDDSRAIVMYDAVRTAIQGVRNAAGSNNVIPSLDDVENAWLRLHGRDHRVEGAGGWICLDRYGTPHNKAVAVVELDPETQSIRFVDLAWPEGTAPDEDCIPDVQE